MKTVASASRNIPIFLFFLSALIFPSTSLAETWKELKGEHFIVYYLYDNQFAQKVIDKAELYYQSIASDLGYPRYRDFWSWEHRVKIYIYGDRDSYAAATHRPEWSGGVADYKNKLISSYAGNQNFLENVLPHEIAHLIFRDFIGFKGEVPLWIDEGVAQWWTAGMKNSVIQTQTKKLFRHGDLLTIDEITNFNIRKLPETDYIKDVRYPDGSSAVLIADRNKLIEIFYLQAASLIGFMRERYGPVRFTNFCQELRDGKTLDKALQSAYGEYFQNTEGLEKEWKDYLSQ